MDIQAVDLQNAGIIFARAGGLKESIKVLHRLESMNATTKSKWNLSCMLNLRGEIALAEGNIPASRLDFTQAAAQYPHVTSQIGLARGYMVSRNWDGAIASWQKVIDARGEHLHSECPSDLGWANLQVARAYHQIGDLVRAREHYKEFLKLWGSSDQALLLRDVEHEMLGSKSVPVVGEEI
jgi:tetratricopeptide (TPR) repeat protein